MGKKIWIIICSVIVVVALVTMVVFVFSGKDKPGEEGTINIEGAWEVVTIVQNESPTFVDGQFMRFSTEKAECYKDGSMTPYAESTYSISGTTISLPDISREYTIEVKTDNHIRLYESPEKWMVLVRYANENLDSVQIDQSVIQGKWNVVFKASGPVAEVLEFKDGTLNDYRDGATTPSASSEYTWNEGVVFAAKWNKSFECHYISDTIIIFVETDTGYIWELEKIA